MSKSVLSTEMTKKLLNSWIKYQDKYQDKLEK